MYKATWLSQLLAEMNGGRTLNERDVRAVTHFDSFRPAGLVIAMTVYHSLFCTSG